MVATVGSIQVLFDAQYGAAVTSLRRFSSESEKAGTRVTRAVAGIDKAAIATHRSLSRLDGSQFRTLTLSALRAQNSVERLRGILLATSGLLGGFGAAFAIKGLQEYSDTYRTLNNQIRAAIGESGDLKKTQEDVFQVAQRSRAEYEATAKLFSRITANSQKLGVSQRDALQVTETIQKAFTLGGSTPIEAAQSSLQLSQGLSSNALGGDELKSVLENNALSNILAKYISDGDKGLLRKMAEERKLTVGVIIRAFKDAGKEIDDAFAKSEETVAGSFQKIDNAMLKYIGTNEQIQTGTSATIVALNAVAENIDTVASAILFLGGAAAGVFGGKGYQQLSGYISRMSQLRKQALDVAIANRKAADLAVNGVVRQGDMQPGVQGTAQRLIMARAAAANPGAIADSTAARKVGEINKEEQKRVQLLKEERTAALNAAKAELDRAKAIKAGTEQALSRAQQVAANKGFIADSEANKAANAQHELEMRSMVALKQQRDEVLALAQAKMDAAKQERDALATRSRLLSGENRSNETPRAAANASTLYNVNKQLDEANKKLAVSQESYNEALRSTATTQAEYNHLRERSDLQGRVQILDNQAAAQKNLSETYRDHVSAARAAADAEANYAQALRGVKDAERAKGVADARGEQDRRDLQAGVAIQARKDLAQAEKEHAIATREAAVATANFKNVLKQQTITAIATRTAMAGLSSVMNFFGGPIGLGLVALSGILALNSYGSAKAQEMMDRYAEAVKNAGTDAFRSAAQIDASTAALERNRTASSKAAEQARTNKAQQDLVDASAQMLIQARGLNSTSIWNKAETQKIVDLTNEFLNGDKALEDYKKELDDISGTAPDLSEALTSFQALADTIQATRALLGLLKSEFTDAGTQPKGGRPGTIYDKRVAPTDEQKQTLAAKMREEQQKRLEDTPANELSDFDARFYGIFDTGKAAKKPGAAKDDPFADAMKSAKEGIAALDAEAQALQRVNPGVKDYGLGLAEAKSAQELLTAAQKGGKEVGKELTDVQQLLYGDLTKLTPAAQQQALAIRQMALATGQAEANVTRLNEVNAKAAEDLEWQKDIMKGAMSTLRSSLIEGKSLWQAMGDVALSVLDKIADRLETNIVDGLFSANGGGFNILSMLFGGSTPAVPKSGGGIAANASGTRSAAAGLSIVGERGPELMQLRGGEKITPSHLLNDEIDNIASSKAGFRSATSAAVDNAGAFRKNSIQGDFRVYVDQDGNWKAEVAKVSYGTASQVAQKAGQHMMGTELPKAVDRTIRSPHRRKAPAE